MKKANIDELKVSGVRPGVTRRSFSGAGACDSRQHGDKRRDLFGVRVTANHY